jgi:hypothetical protein
VLVRPVFGVELPFLFELLENVVAKQKAQV